ncbi:hypothetical protein G9A89_023918 [Geosiphon pyriformis]|nr:hypothetical protein G9A89_023918 [Geosiphon pyriformis]
MLVSDFVKSGGLVKSFSPAFGSSFKLDVSNMDYFGFIYSSLKNAFLPVISVYTDGSVKDFDTSGTVRGAAAYFSDLSLHIGVEVHSLLSTTLTKMQTVVLALKCILASSNVTVFSDSQAFLDVCQMKGYSGVLGNEHANWLADLAMSSGLVLPANIREKILMADDKLIFGNIHHFKFGPGSSIVDFLWVRNINWVCTVLVWHSDSHMSAEYTNRATTGMATGHKEQIWMPNSKLRTKIEHHRLLCVDGSFYDIIWDFLAKISGGIARLLGIKRSYATNFGLSIGHLFFIGAANRVTVNIVA